MTAELDVTVVICTFNRSALLSQTLERITQVSAPSPNWELLLLDNNSSDSTKAVAEAFAKRLPLRYLFEGRQGKTHALNRSLDEARSDLIVWTDDDVLVELNWLDALLSASRRFPEAALFGGPVAPWFPVEPSPELLEAFPIVRSGFCGVDYDLPEGPAPAPYWVHGANMACRRSRIGRARYNESLGPSGTQWMGNDDTTFVTAVRREGGTMIWVPSMAVRHYVDPGRLTVTYLRKHYRGAGLTWIRDSGVPAGRRLFGVPVWMWQRWLLHGAGFALTRPWSRKRGWQHLREFSRFEGAVQAARELRSSAR